MTSSLADAVIELATGFSGPSKFFHVNQNIRPT
jgi:hypothetical protein